MITEFFPWWKISFATSNKVENTLRDVGEQDAFMDINTEPLQQAWHKGRKCSIWLNLEGC